VGLVTPWVPAVRGAGHGSGAPAPGAGVESATSADVELAAPLVRPPRAVSDAPLGRSGRSTPGLLHFFSTAVNFLC
jgi:hypothetical protein